jgi:NAD(P)-dependent dehydrogenase (short-subunit alcohol dehydrogenase family)
MTNELRFEHRVVAITGAHHGLGRAHAELLARRGAKVVVNDLAGAAETVAAIRGAGGDAIESTSDITRPDGTDRIVADALGTWGRLDVIVNNAAGGPITTLGDDAGSRACVDVHFFGTQNLMRSSMPVFRERNYGRIVNTSSGSVMGIPHTGSYAAGKGAVLALSKVLANELRAEPEVDIKVNVLMPAAQTPNFPPVPDDRVQAILQHAFAAEQCSPLVAVLAHESCPVSGEALQVGGGRVSRFVLATTEGWQGPDGGLTPENIADHWDDIVATRDLREPVGSMADIFGRRGEHPYTAIEIYRWATTGEAPTRESGAEL